MILRKKASEVTGTFILVKNHYRIISNKLEKFSLLFVQIEDLKPVAPPLKNSYVKMQIATC
jgi:hypothetical protein